MIVEFNYTKASGITSARVGFIVTKPTSNYFILDVSDMDAEDIDRIEQDYSAYIAEQKALLEKYKLTQYLKQFKSEGMSNVQNSG